MKTIAITGGAQGIGRGIALHFADLGYAVSLADPAEDAGAEVVAMIERAGGRAIHLPVDVAEVDAVTEWIARTEAAFGCPDALVNNAGILRNAPFLELSPDDFDRVIAVNLRGSFLCTQAVTRRMVARGQRAAIVNIASTRAHVRTRHRGLHGVQGRHRRAHPRDGHQSRRARHPRELHQPRLDRGGRLAVFGARADPAAQRS